MFNEPLWPVTKLNVSLYKSLSVNPDGRVITSGRDLTITENLNNLLYRIFWEIKHFRVLVKVCLQSAFGLNRCLSYACEVYRETRAASPSQRRAKQERLIKKSWRGSVMNAVCLCWAMSLCEESWVFSFWGSETRCLAENFNANLRPC